jgi:hypothetical protein
MALITLTYDDRAVLEAQRELSARALCSATPYTKSTGYERMLLAPWLVVCQSGVTSQISGMQAFVPN